MAGVNRDCNQECIWNAPGTGCIKTDSIVCTMQNAVNVEVIKLCPEFKDELVPMCVRNGGVCYEMFPCGRRAEDA